LVSDFPRDKNDLEISLSSAIVVNIAYGIDVQESDDPYLSLAEEALNGLNQAAILGTFWVDLFPLLKYVPSWFPGAGFQKKAAHWREINATLAEKPFRYVEEQLVGRTFFFESSWACSCKKFCRRMAKLRHAWQQPSLIAFLIKKILTGPWRKGLRKNWVLRSI
jgi:hypothetical protein